uniref:photosystem I n=1 Tax=Brassica oleracea var. oleracea TaxID=109376 RepID=A0A0D3EEW2_BRAOL
MYSLPAYAFIAQDFTTQAALYTHHQYIAGFIMTGAFAHGAIFFIRDYNPEQNEDNVLARMLDHKEAIISHLSWASLFLGFHTLGLYVHNDVMLAFGTPEKQILIEPIFAQWIQSAHGKTSYGFDVLLSSTNGPAFNAGRSIWLPGWLNAINENSNSLFLTIGPGDFLVHHAIALGLHTTTLILVKGALDARGSKLMPDKKDFGYSFPCDGPGRGGTCDISAWDAFYLAELIETLAWAHERTPLANLIRWKDKPVALSILLAQLKELLVYLSIESNLPKVVLTPIIPHHPLLSASLIAQPNQRQKKQHKSNNNYHGNKKNNNRYRRNRGNYNFCPNYPTLLPSNNWNGRSKAWPQQFANGSPFIQQPTYRGPSASATPQTSQAHLVENPAQFAQAYSSETLTDPTGGDWFMDSGAMAHLSTEPYILLPSLKRNTNHSVIVDFVRRLPGSLDDFLEVV